MIVIIKCFLYLNGNEETEVLELYLVTHSRFYAFADQRRSRLFLSGGFKEDNSQPTSLILIERRQQLCPPTMIIKENREVRATGKRIRSNRSLKEQLPLQSCLWRFHAHFGQPGTVSRERGAHCVDDIKWMWVVACSQAMI